MRYSYLVYFADNGSEFTHQFANPVQNKINDLFSNGIVSTGIIVSCILLASDQLLRVEQLAIRPSPHLI